MIEEPSRPALRYHGSKWNLAPWIISFFVEHDCYCEPYGGGAAVLLRKARSWLEVYNDKDHAVWNFFKMLRDHRDDLIRRIELTPYSKREWELAEASDPDPIETARRFYVRAYQGIAGATGQWNTGWRRQKVVTRQNGKRRMTPAAKSFMQVDHLYQVADRLRGVYLECDEALEIIERYDSPATLFYLDPPYPASTRGRWANKAYQHEMSDEDHRVVARALNNIAGMAVISSYRCDLYDENYADWHRMDKTIRTNSGGSATESVWLSPKLFERWKSKLPMFEANHFNLAEKENKRS